MLGRIRWVPKLSRREFLARHSGISVETAPWNNLDKRQTITSFLPSVLATHWFHYSSLLLGLSHSGAVPCLSLVSLQFLSAVDMSKLHVCSGHYKEWSGGPL